ncbi:MAG: 1-deoxy-D-xylulose-5-phosphate reductoisomerase [Kiritimatiellae bacterium]|nr:1-deoxy-D-xylulose-5-phosphate reductoisomerase [Kiritimatiellia bacterium]
MKRVVILGSTGSIGESALRVIDTLSDRFRLVGLCAQTRVDRLLEQAAAFQVPAVAVADEEAAARCARKAPPGLRVLSGADGVAELAACPEADIVLCAVVGTAGLRPVLAALARGTDVALATKEALVAAGALVIQTARAHGARLLPVDSEHSALFQCLRDAPPETVERLIITGSGGPFTARPPADWERVTAEEAVAHPRWNMGRKISVDSATLMNKGLEIIEAHWFFGVPEERIRVLIHPESIVHAMVEFVDGSVLAQLNPVDMRFAIQYALTYPARVDGKMARLDLARIGALHFAEPDLDRFPCLGLARQAARAGGTVPAVLTAANEVAVQRFLDGELTFPGIWDVVAAAVKRHTAVAQPTLQDVLDADAWARAEAEQLVRARRPRE